MRSFILSFILLCFTNIWQFNLCYDEEVESSGEDEEVESSGEGETSEPFLEYTCRIGWSRHKNYCYDFNNGRKTWVEAKEACSRKHSHLSDIYNKEENDFIRERIKQDTWIGGNDIEEENDWRWTNGNKISYTHWEYPEPNNIRNEDCAVIRRWHGMWNDYPCYFQENYVCKYKIDEEVENLGEGKTSETFLDNGQDVSPRVETTCRSGWKQKKNYCYYHNGESTYWENAKNICASKNSYLTDVNSLEENDYLRENIRGDLWIGANDKEEEDDWRWTNGDKLSFTNWEKKEPNNWQNEDCAVIRLGHGLWNDYACHRRNYYICKYKLDQNVENSKEGEEFESSGEGGLCKQNWISFGNACYLFHSKLMNWHDANILCEHEDSNLVDINNKKENDFLSGHITTDVWTSGNDKKNEGDWRWSDDKGMIFENWVYGHHLYTGLYGPNKYPFNSEDCLSLSGKDDNWHKGYWQQEACFLKRGFICKYSGGEIEEPFINAKIDEPFLNAQDVGSSGEAEKEENLGKDKNIECSIPDKEVEISEKEKSCKIHWKKNNNYCYYFGTTFEVTWERAKEKCSDEESHLVDINNEEENDFLRENIYNNLLWIGGNDIEEESMWRWTNGDKISYKNWESTEPNNWQNEDCAVIRSGHGLWNDDRCLATHHYICKYRLDQNIENSEEVVEVESSEEGGSCKKNWISFGNACYLFQRIALSWSEAKVICISEDSLLVDVQNKEENDFLIEHTDGDVWTSGNDKDSEGDWRWDNKGSFHFTNWRYGEPNNAGFLEDCMSVIGETNNNWIKGYWYDDSCSFHKQFICKYTKEETKESFSGTGNEETKESYSGSYTDSEETKESFSGTGNEERIESSSGSSEENEERIESSSGSSEENGFDYYDIGSANGKDEEIETTEEVETPFVKMTTPEQFFFTEPEENQETTGIVPILTANDHCKEGWEQYSEACYLFRSDLQNWNDAQNECLHLSGHLVDIQSNDELQYIKEKSENVWIGERHYMNTIEENYITEEQGCATIGHLDKDATSEHNKEECLYLRPYVCKYYTKSDDNEIHPTWK